MRALPLHASPGMPHPCGRCVATTGWGTGGRRGGEAHHRPECEPLKDWAVAMLICGVVAASIGLGVLIAGLGAHTHGSRLPIGTAGSQVVSLADGPKTGSGSDADPKDPSVSADGPMSSSLTDAMSSLSPCTSLPELSFKRLQVRASCLAACYAPFLSRQVHNLPYRCASCPPCTPFWPCSTIIFHSPCLHSLSWPHLEPPSRAGERRAIGRAPADKRYTARRRAHHNDGPVGLGQSFLSALSGVRRHCPRLPHPLLAISRPLASLGRGPA